MPDFSPGTTIRQWPKGQKFSIADATTGAICFGATGSGKTSGVAKHLAIGYMEAGFGGLVLCAKAEERRQWQHWAEEAGRSRDLRIFDASDRHRFDFLEWEASRAGDGGGLVINIVQLLDEIAVAASRAGGASQGGGGDAKFFEGALHLMLVALVALAHASGEPVTVPRLRELASGAARSPTELKCREWQEASPTAALLKRLAAEHAVETDPERRADLAELFAYWTGDFPELSDRTRGIIEMMFSMLVQPFLYQPLRRLFTSGRSTLTPEDTFSGKIIIIDLPVQEFRLAGQVAALAWKHCFQIAVMRRTPPARGHLPVTFLWADECQTFTSPFDAEYQAVARSAGGATVYLTQNRESLKRTLGSDETVDSLLGNLQAKFFCQNSSIATNEWASKLLGERWIDMETRSVQQSFAQGPDDRGSTNGGSSRKPEKIRYLEAGAFATLRRGGVAYDHRVSAIVYKGGALFEGDNGERVPFTTLTFNQLR